MTPREHQQKFYESLALAITQWQYVESGLFGVFCALTKIPNRTIASAVFFSPLSFSIKLKMVDSAAQFALMDSPLLKEWNKIHVQASKRARKRNELVHFMVMSESDGRNRLRPNISDAQSALHYQKKGAIPEYTTKQLAEKARSFGNLFRRMENFADALHGKPPTYCLEAFGSTQGIRGQR